MSNSKSASSDNSGSKHSKPSFKSFTSSQLQLQLQQQQQPFQQQSIRSSSGNTREHLVSLADQNRPKLNANVDTITTENSHANNPDNGGRNNNNSNNNNINNNYFHDSIDINTYYSLKANTIPPFVLDRLVKKLDLETYNSTNDNKTNHNVFDNLDDPFTSTFKDSKNKFKWGEFLNSIKTVDSSIPVKASNDNRNKKNSPDTMDDENDEIRSYCATINSGEKQQITNDAFKRYDFNSEWKGGNRLKGLFESPDAECSDNYYSESETTVSMDIDNEIESATSNQNQNQSRNQHELNADLEKGLTSKKHHSRKRNRFNIHRLNRENAIKKRAKYWIQENKQDWRPKLFESIKTNSYFPLFFRLISLTLTCIALGLSARLVKLTQNNNVSQQPSPLMAMIVQSVAILYLFYITYDEFTSQPLGLRNPRAKIRLVLLDLIIIIFLSANLSLSFQSIYDDRWVCTISDDIGDILYNPEMCEQVKALTAFLLVTLVVWCINVSISVFRIVHVVSYSREKN